MRSSRARECGLAVLVGFALLSCTDQPTRPDEDQTAASGPALAVSNPPGASVSRQVEVPATMRSAPFDVPRYLTLPPGFSVAVYARVRNARFLAVTPEGNLLVSQPNKGNVKLIRPTGGGDPIISNFVTALRNPHDMVFHSIGTTTYLYVAESHQIDRYLYRSGDRTGRGRQIVVTGLPDQATAGLEYNHALKNIALDLNHRLYVSIASGCDACAEDTRSSPKRGAIYRYNADGSGARLFAQGLRNAEGLAFVPGTNELWAVANQQNAVTYPYDDGTGQYGQKIQPYIDDHPPEMFTRVRLDGNYGWPFCNPNPDGPSGYDTMPFDRDYDTNRDGSVDCGAMNRITKGIQAHSAPLGLTFLQGTNVPAAYRQGVVVSLHGSGKPRSQRTGANLIYFPWDGVNRQPGAQMDLVTGWLLGETYWGRPVDVAVNPEGQMFIADDFSGTIYKLFPTP